MASVAIAKPVKSKAVFSAESLPIAIGNLFAMNNYEVKYDLHIHGAQIDLVATAKGDPFAAPIYVEATIEYVTNDKYAKDSTKFLLIRNKNPGAKLLCISSTGFTAGVQERALESGIEALTYDDLFSKFEKFTPYLEYTFSNKDIKSLVSSYEEPFFNDEKGIESATAWLNRWKSYAPEEAKWLIILGEYGTGKTSLTRILQHRWLWDYNENPAAPIPVRIELRNFNRQFDSNGLLHHFLDTNKLSHVSIDFMIHLIKTGRVILLLDGYDEMAQFLNARERRACLNALADLASDGAKGILTSRPNYFTESEELNVFEALYRNLEQTSFHLSKSERAFIASEKSVDDLIERYILNKYERFLQDLNPEQTKSLVRRKLSKDPEGQQIVLGILDRVFREEASGAKQALSGKPVIISYLLELVDDLRGDAKSGNLSYLTEWQVYKLIVDKLMLRDLQRTGMNPDLRRQSLQKIAAAISGRDKIVADEAVFENIIEQDFQRDLRSLPTEEKRSRRLEIFEDLRSSATLTRAAQTKSDGWVFSHNSLREFLVSEQLLNSLVKRAPIDTSIPISAAMRGFAGSIGEKDLEEIWSALTEVWPQRVSHYNLGPYISLLWEAARRTEGGVRGVLSRLNAAPIDATSEQIDFNNLIVKDLNFSDEFSGAAFCCNAKDSAFTDCNLSNLSLDGSVFSDTIFDNVDFKECSLNNVNFTGSLLFDVNISGATLTGANFSHLDPDSSIIVDREEGPESLDGNKAVGYLLYNGAITDAISEYYIQINNPRYVIVRKIIEKVAEQRNSQFRGLTQRGGSRLDPPFARAFVERLVGEGWFAIDKNELVSVTSAGRGEIQKMVTGEYMPAVVSNFLKAYV